MIKIKVKLPAKNPFDAVKLDRVINNALNESAMGVKADFGVTTQTWNNKPEFKIDKPATYRRVIYTTSDIYRYVSGGTSVRRAVMSPGFRAKTRPGWIGSNKGRGGVVFISKRINLPGIKARNFDKVIHRKWKKTFPQELQRAIDAEF